MSNETTDALKERDEAWARLLKAEVAEASREEWYAPHYAEEIRAAKQALCDLGVDVEALLAEGS